jgi:hypothetical protein
METWTMGVSFPLFMVKASQGTSRCGYNPREGHGVGLNPTSSRRANLLVASPASNTMSAMTMIKYFPRR